MRSTYMNERMTDTYPFVPGTELPFSYGCIADLKICLHMRLADGSGAPGNPVVVRMTSVQITDDRITATLCMQPDMFLCQVTATSEASTVVAAQGDGFEASVQLSVGRILPTDKGSWVTDLVVEPACVWIMPQSVYTGTTGITVNGIDMVLGETLDIRTAGYYAARLSDGTANHRTLWLAADVPDDADMTIAPTAVNYDMVTQLNEFTINASTTLVITIACKDIEGYSNRVLGYALSGDLGDEGRTRKNTVRGTYIVLTLNGTHLVPNCYTAAEDEAEALAEVGVQ